MLATKDIAQRAVSRALGLMPVTSIWEPNEGPQTDADTCTADVLGYGGAAGGGKTDLQLGKGFRKFKKGIIFRARFTDLVDVVTRGDQILDGLATFVWGSKKRWDLPGGRSLELGAVEHENDKNKYRGRPHDMIGIDEAAEFRESIFRFITGWLRTTDPEQRTQIVLTFNPPTTPEGEWIIKYFGPWLDPEYLGERAQPGELRWFVYDGHKDVEVPGPQPVVIEGREYTPKSRTFIPAKLEDNPYLLNTEYAVQLDTLPEPLRSQLRFGNFIARQPDDPWQVIPTSWVQAAQRRWVDTPQPDVKARSMAEDVARGGADKTVIARLYGSWFAPLIGYAGEQTPDGPTAAKYFWDALQADGGEALAFVDVVGIGSSAFDHLRKVLQYTQTYAVNFGSGSEQTDKSGKFKFFNLRAEAYWRFREALDPDSGQDVCLPPGRELMADLTAPKFEIVSGKIKIEPKEDIKKRIGRSPDQGDTVVMAWWGANKPPLILRSFDW